MRLICFAFVVTLFFAGIVEGQDPGEPIAGYSLDEDFQYRIDTGDWVTFTPNHAEEKLEPLPADHWWVKNLEESPVMEFAALFEDATAENPRSLWWGIDTSTGGISFPRRHHKFYVRWRNRFYTGTPYEIIGDWCDPSDYVRVVRLRPSGKVLAINPRKVEP